MNRRLSAVGLVAALAPVALGLGGCTSDPAVATAASPSATASATPTALATPPAGPVSRPPGAPPLVTEQPSGDLAAGRYTVPANGAADLPLAVVDLPDGYGSGGFFLDSPGGGVVSYWGIATVYDNPCARERPEVVTGDASAVVDQLFHALLIQMTAPTPVSVGGQQGVYVELTSPDIDYSDCVIGLTYWDSGDGHRFVEEPGVVDRLWVLDVDGEVVILGLSSPRGTTQAALRDAVAVVERTRFIRADGTAVS